MVELLSEKNLNNPTDIILRLDDTKEDLLKLYTRFDNLKKHYSTEHYNKLLNPIAELIGDDIDFVYILWNYFSNYFPDIDNLKSGFKRDEEVKKLGDSIRNLDLSNKSQTMAFYNISIDEIFEQEIVQVSNFTLNRSFKLINDLRSTSTLYYDVVLPFHDKNYVNSTDCTHHWDLPEFYKPKTKMFHY